MRHHLATATALGLLALGPASVIRASEPDAMRVLLEAAGPAPVDKDLSYAQLEELLLHGVRLAPALADGATLPDARPDLVVEQVGLMSCGTGLVRAIEQALPRADSERAEPLRLLLTPPSFAAESALPVQGEAAIIRYEASVLSRHAAPRRSSDGDGQPEAISDLADDVRTSMRRIADLTGWSRRFDDGPLEIRLASVPFDDGEALPTHPPIIVIPVQARGASRLAAVAHQVAHAVVHDAAPDMPASFEEALATHLAESVLADELDLSIPAAELLPSHHPQRTILSPGIEGSRDDAAFLRFVTQVLGLPPSFVAEILVAFEHQDETLRDSGRVPADEVPQAAVAEALDEVLGRHGWTLPDALAEAQAWSLEQDLVHRGPMVTVDDEMDRLPAELAIAPSAMPPFSQQRLGIPVPSLGGLKIAFDGCEGLRAQAIVLLADGTVQRFPLEGGRQMLGLPVASLRRAVVLVQAPDIPRRWSAWSATPATTEDARLRVMEDPSYPLVLSALSTESWPGQVTVSWDTSSEEDILGFWVERAMRPAGPWRRVSQAPVPAQSGLGSAASYSLVDATLRTGLAYHYRVRAVTASGLSVVTPAVVAQALPRPAR
jgi:hypothetical protein